MLGFAFGSIACGLCLLSLGALHVPQSLDHVGGGLLGPGVPFALGVRGRGVVVSAQGLLPFAGDVVGGLPSLGLANDQLVGGPSTFHPLGCGLGFQRGSRCGVCVHGGSLFLVLGGFRRRCGGL